MAARRGFGGYSYSRVAGDAALEVGGSGVVAVATGLAANAVATAVFEVRDEVGGAARFSLRVGAGASADGFGEAMFVIGGGRG